MRLLFERVRLRNGHDPMGDYWGIGKQLWVASSNAGYGIRLYLRDDSHHKALARILQFYPDAEIYSLELDLNSKGSPHPSRSK